MYIDDELKRAFYIEMCKLEKWTTRTLEERIESMLYERTALSKKPEETIKTELELMKNKQKINPDLVFKNPYFLDFLGLKNIYDEKDLEDAIVVQMQEFIIELGSDFAFMARQKLIMIDSEDYHLDLLFFHRRLKCLVAIDLKLGKFKPSHKGQMELYLRWIEKNIMLEGENPPIGLILCSEGNTEHIEYLMLDDGNIKVAQYYTQLPDKKILSEKLQRAIAIAREHHANLNIIKNEV
jgi:predicted nuclease of restriction endonuclease-like (RecB) superfamily